MVGGGVGVAFGSYGINVFVLVSVGTSCVLVADGTDVFVGGTLVSVYTIGGAANVGGKALVAVFSGVEVKDNVAVGAGTSVDVRLQLNIIKAREIIPVIWPILLFILPSALILSSNHNDSIKIPVQSTIFSSIRGKNGI